MQRSHHALCTQQFLRQISRYTISKTTDDASSPGSIASIAWIESTRPVHRLRHRPSTPPTLSHAFVISSHTLPEPAPTDRWKNLDEMNPDTQRPSINITRATIHLDHQRHRSSWFVPLGQIQLVAILHGPRCYQQRAVLV